MRRCELCGEAWDGKSAMAASKDVGELAAFGGALWELAEACPRCGCLRCAAELVGSGERSL